MNFPAAIAGAALAVQVAGAPTDAVARAYAVVLERRPDIIARQDSKYGRKELLHWQATFTQDLTRTETAVFGAVLEHYNHHRGDAFPGYRRIAELSRALAGLMGAGAYVQKGEARHDIGGFGEAMQWLMEQAKN